MDATSLHLSTSVDKKKKKKQKRSRSESREVKVKRVCIHQEKENIPPHDYEIHYQHESTSTKPVEHGNTSSKPTKHKHKTQHHMSEEINVSSQDVPIPPPLPSIAEQAMKKKKRAPRTYKFLNEEQLKPLFNEHKQLVLVHEDLLDNSRVRVVVRTARLKHPEFLTHGLLSVVDLDGIVHMLPMNGRSSTRIQSSSVRRGLTILNACQSMRIPSLDKPCFLREFGFGSKSTTNVLTDYKAMVEAAKEEEVWEQGPFVEP